MLQDEREVLPSNSEVTGAANSVGVAAAAAAVVAPHGIEVAAEFKPVEHPTEPFDNDRPVQCPLPEPSILNVSFEPHMLFPNQFFVNHPCFTSCESTICRASKHKDKCIHNSFRFGG